MTPLLEISDLTRDYRGGLLGGGPPVRALDGVSLHVEAGEILGVVGASGSGKSTLARLAVALDRPTAGTVRFEGADLNALRPAALARARAGFQMVFQDPYGSLDPRWRAGRSVAEPLALVRPRLGREARSARVAEALADVGLKGEEGLRFPHEFSGGQRQRIALARALVTRPRLVVADEAVSALDLSVQAQILNLILDLRERDGVAVLFVTHDLAVVEAICDRVAVMHRGRIVETGPVAAVFDRPDHPYTRALLAARAPPPVRDPS